MRLRNFFPLFKNLFPVNITTLSPALKTIKFENSSIHNLKETTIDQKSLGFQKHYFSTKKPNSSDPCPTIFGHIMEKDPNCTKLINIFKHDIQHSKYNSFNALQIAALSNNPLIFKAIINKKYFSVDTQDGKGNSLLHLAVIGNSKEVLLHILKHYPQLINGKNKAGDTALHIATRLQNREFANLLMQHRASSLDFNEIYETPLAIAKKNDDSKTATLINNYQNNKPIEQNLTRNDDSALLFLINAMNIYYIMNMMDLLHNFEGTTGQFKAKLGEEGEAKHLLNTKTDQQTNSDDLEISKGANKIENFHQEPTSHTPSYEINHHHSSTPDTSVNSPSSWSSSHDTSTSYSSGRDSDNSTGGFGGIE